eukprot:6548839-Pyramimonas_sp.AAC.1
MNDAFGRPRVRTSSCLPTPVPQPDITVFPDTVTVEADAELRTGLPLAVSSGRVMPSAGSSGTRACPMWSFVVAES